MGSIDTIISLGAIGVAGYLLLQAKNSGAWDSLFTPPAGGGGGGEYQEPPPSGGGGGGGGGNCDCAGYGAGGSGDGGGGGDSGGGDSGGDGGGKKSGGGKKKKKSNYSVAYMAQRVMPLRSAAGVLAQRDPLSGQEYYYKAFAASSSLCSSRYHGKCNTECSEGSPAECRDCQIACGLTTGTNLNFYSGGGGTQIGAVQAGATRDPQRCHEEFNGSCPRECQSPNSTACITCRMVCEGHYPPVVAPAEGDDEGGGDDESGPGKPAPGAGGGSGGDQTAADPCIAECGFQNGGGGGDSGGGGGGGGAGAALGCGFSVRPMDSDPNRWRTDDAQGNEVSGGKVYLKSKAEQEAWSRTECQKRGGGAGGARAGGVIVFPQNGRNGRGTDVPRIYYGQFARYYGEGRLSQGNRVGDLRDSIYPEYVLSSGATYGWENQPGPYAYRAGITPNRAAYPSWALTPPAPNVIKPRVAGVPKRAYYVSDIAYSNTTSNDNGTQRDFNRISMNTTYGDYRYIARPNTAPRTIAQTVSLF